MSFFKKYVMQWKNLVPILFTVLSFLTPSIRAYDTANPHTFLAQVFIVMLALLHTTAPKDKK